MLTLYPLNLDENGVLANRTDFPSIINAITLADPLVTDVWILSYGWNNDDASGTKTYEQWITSLANDPVALNNDQYNPFYIGVYWPSAAWATDVGTVTCISMALQGR